MSKNIFYYILLLAGFATVLSCSKETTELFLGTSQIGLNTSETKFTYVRDGSGAVLPSGIQVILLGELSGSAINYTINAQALRDSSSAIENLHYELTAESGSIAANSATAILPINVFPDNIEINEDVELYIELSSSDYDIAPNFNKVRYELEITCPLDDTKFTGDYQISYLDAVFPFGPATFGEEGKIVNLTNVSGAPSKRMFSYTYLESGGFGNAPVNFAFGLICGSVNPDSDQVGGLSCTSGFDITLGPASQAAAFDPANDGTLDIIFEEFVEDGDCGVNPVTQTIRLTKV